MTKPLRPEIIRLYLHKPLFYAPDESVDLFNSGSRTNPNNSGWEGIERLFCYELEEMQAKEFEPNKEYFPGALIFRGEAASREKTGNEVFELKPGNYLFCQVQKGLDLEEIVELAIKVQNEGLWQRLVLDRYFYVRRLFEDGRELTQIWRPFS